MLPEDIPIFLLIFKLIRCCQTFGNTTILTNNYKHTWYYVYTYAKMPQLHGETSVAIRNQIQLQLISIHVPTQLLNSNAVVLFIEYISIRQQHKHLPSTILGCFNMDINLRNLKLTS